jgi:murein DD-endopeptidase MepM/ murein hydrolase activator NlpD
MVTIAWAAATAGCDGQDAGDEAGRTSTEPPTLSPPSVALPVTPGSEVHPSTPTVTASTADTSASLRETVGGATRAAGAPATRSEAVSRSTSNEGAPVTERDLAVLAAGLVVPVSGVARSELRDSYTEARGAGGERPHEAIDIMAARGTPVVAATDGRLLKLFNSTPGGLMIYTTDATERFILFYGHLDGYAAGLTDGMRLTRGQVIGYVGTTGNAPPGAPHLHFGILRGNPSVSWSEGTPVNPYPLLAPK